MIGQKKSVEDLTLSSLSLSELNRVLIRIGDLLSQAHGIGQAHDLNGSRIVNVGSPMQTGDAINKGALDSGLEPKTDGPDSSTDNAVVRWDGNDGKKLQNSLVIVDDAGSVNIPAGQTYKIGGDPHTHAFDDLSDVDFTGEAWGDIVFRGETKWNNLAAGEDGQVFTTHGPDAPPTWENLPIATDIHAADGKTTPADADELGLVDSADSYALKSLTWANIKATLKSYFDGVYGAIAGDGWEKDPDTWVYGSASYFYIAGKDVTARFPRGAKIKLTQGGTVKYWYVNYSEYSCGNTSVVVALTPDYTLANATITSPYYSYASNPQGFPACFNHSDSWDGFSTDPSGGCCNYSVEGGMVTLNVYRASDGTADANNCTINLPLESRDAANYVAFSFGYTVKEATLALGFAYVTQKSYGATLVHAPGAAATDWNTSGNKNWIGQIRYHL